MNRKFDHARRVLDGARADPCRPRVGRALHEEIFTRGAVRVTLHDHRAIFKIGQQIGRGLDLDGADLLEFSPDGDPRRVLASRQAVKQQKPRD